MKLIPYGRHSIDDKDISAVLAVLRSDFLTTGPGIDTFEREFAQFVGAEHAIAVCNATAALHLAMRVTEIGPGHRVVTSANTFLASANCAAYVRAIPDFCDIDPISYNLDAVELEEGWKPDTKAVIAVDYGGQPCDLPTIARVARERGAFVIEDACHGVGGRFQHEGETWKLGGHPWADITVFSFHPVKTITAGEGGMLVTNNYEYACKARLLRNHGMQRDHSRFREFGHLGDPLCEIGPWAYEMQCLGHNYRITDLQCALGLSQLNRLDQFIARRRDIVRQYNEALSDLPWLRIPGLKNAENRDLISWHLYTVKIDFSAIGKTRTQTMNELRDKGIGTQVLYIPVYLQPWYRQTYGYAPGKCANAESFYAQALSLPLYPGLSDQEVQYVIQTIRSLTIRK